MFYVYVRYFLLALSEHVNLDISAIMPLVPEINEIGAYVLLSSLFRSSRGWYSIQILQLTSVEFIFNIFIIKPKSGSTFMPLILTNRQSLEWSAAHEISLSLLAYNAFELFRS